MSQAAGFGGSVPRVYNDLLGPLIFEACARDMVERLALGGAGGVGGVGGAGGRVLEVACGTGIVTREIAKALPAGASLLASDLNPDMLELARAGLAGDPRVTMRVVDASALPFADASFDVIACQYGVMFFPDKVGSMKHARRVLRPGGRYVFSVWDSLEHNPMADAVHQTLARLYPENPPAFLGQLPYGWSDRGEIERTVRAGGFANVRLETVAFPSEAPTAAAAAKAWVEGTPLRPALAERGTADPTAVREKVERVLADRFGAAPCRATMRAVVATAC